jgi:putative PEP-CTERM system TPR-repeat lipoprotein
VARAKSQLEKQDVGAAVIELKAVLQKNPRSGEGRYMLGQTLLQIGDAGGAVLELTKARELKYSDDLVLPTLAKALLATGQAKKVSDGFDAVSLTDSKAAAELKATVAQSFLAQGMVERAGESVQAALKLNPKNSAARLQLARSMAGRGEFDQAMAQVDALIADEPKLAQVWALKGELLWVSKSDVKGGEKALRQALAIDPRFMRAHESLIQLLMQSNDIAGFKAEVETLNKVMPNRIESRFYSTHLALIDNDLKKAQAGVQQLLKVAPESAQVLQLAGAIELRTGAISQAQTHLKQAMQIEPKAGVARLLLAETQLREGQPSLALATLQPYLEGTKPSARALGLAAEAYLQDGDMTQAELYYSRAAKVALAMPERAKGKTAVGFSQLESLAAADKATYADLALIAARVRSNDLDAALRAVERLQSKAPNAALPYVVRGRILLQRHDVAGARASFDKALTVDAASFAAVSELAAMDIGAKKPDEARKRFEALLERQPKNARARLAIIELRERAGAKPEEIVALAAAAVTANPEQVAPRLFLTEYHLRMHRAKAALAAAQDAVAAFPDNLLALDALGRAQLAAGDSMQAVQTFQRIAASQTTTPLPHLRLAETYVASKDYAAATQSLKKALEIAPRLLAAQRQLAQVLSTRKKVGEALEVAKQVQKQRPRESAGFIIESEIHARQKDWVPAIGAFRAALERDRSTDLAIRLHTLYTVADRSAEAARFAASWEAEAPKDAGFLSYMGMQLASRKDYAAAEAQYRKVLALRPDDPDTLNNLSWLLLRQGKAGALELAERANELVPEQANFMDTLAAALAADKQLKKALEWQQKAIAKDPNAAGLRLNLAKLQIESGDRVQARAELQKLAALGGRFSRQAEVEALLKGL